MLSNIIKDLNKSIKLFIKLNILTKTIFFLILIIIFLTIINANKSNIEGYRNNNIDEKIYKKNFFESKYDNDVYDKLYAQIYDLVNLNIKKNNEEINSLKPYFKKFDYTKILDVGCGTGNHVKILEENNYDVLGIDKSDAMIKVAKKNYPKCNFLVNDILNDNIFETGTFTHILCLNKTFYLLDSKEMFFQNCYSLLNNNGYLIINLLDLDNINYYSNLDNKKNKLIYDSKKYGIKPNSHIVKFDNNIEFYSYCKNKDDKLIYNETFKNFKINSCRKNEIIYKLKSEKYIIELAKKNNFKLIRKIELQNNKNNFLHIFKAI